MDAAEISYRLRRLGKTQAQIARDIGVSGGVVSNVIYGRVSAYGVAQHIAGLIGLSIEEIWPERYVFKPRTSVAKPPREQNEATDREVKP